MQDRVSQEAIDSIAKHINDRHNKPYSIPIVTTETNPETPQYFEIIPFDKIDESNIKFFAIDGSNNSHSFYNGLSIGLYRAGYVCYQFGKQLRMNTLDDPVIFGQAYTPNNILITCDEHKLSIYNELLQLPAVDRFIKYLGDKPDDIFGYDKNTICQSISRLLSFCQDILEWALIYEIASKDNIKQGDYILKDGALRSMDIKQKYLVKLGKYLSKEKQVILVGITKNTPIKMELSYTLRQIDNYLQDKLKPKYPFKEEDPKRQKLCCWFEVPGDVLSSSYENDMFARKSITGGRGSGLFFSARLDYVEKLQNYDWVVADLNIFDAIPDIENNDMKRDMTKLKSIFNNLTRLTQEHYILGYPYPLVEVHNFVTLKADFKEEVINKVKHSMYSTQHMDHIDIENLFLDIHSRF